MLVRIFPRGILFMLLITTLTLAACNVGATPAPTVDVNAINTAAVATAMGQISAQLTQTALAVPSNTPTPTNTALALSTSALPTTGAGTAATAGLPTLSFNTTPNTTPIAGFTPISGSPAAPVNPVDTCNNSAYISDVTIPDGTVLRPGADFVKTWRVQNTGTCAWDEGYKLVFIAGDRALDPVSFEITSADDFVAAGATDDLSIDLTAPEAEGSYTATWQMQTDTGAYFGTPLTVVIEVQD
jgi:hypothetical protein